MTNCTVETFGLSSLSGDVVGHLAELLLHGCKPVAVDLLMMGQGIVIFIAILSDNLISRGQVRVALTLSSAQAYHFQDVKLLCDTPDNRLRLSLHPTKKAVHEILEMLYLLTSKMTGCPHVGFKLVHL